MTTLNTQTYGQLVSSQVTAVQASSTQLIDFQEGSVLLSLIESNAASVGLWLQGLILTLLATTRLATSSSADVDSFISDYGLTRLPAVAATGVVTFARFTSTFQAIVPIGTQIQSADGTQIFTVTIDTTNSNYNPGLNGYVLSAGTSSINVPVLAATAGTLGNLGIGTLNTLISPIPYVDTVTNTIAFTNGSAAESDAAVKIRFVNYINTLSRATKAAISYAVSIAQQNLSYNLTENLNYNGTSNTGYFYGVVDDGSHAPSSTVLSNVGASVELYRAFTVTYGIFGPTTVTASVVMTIATSANYTHASIVSIVTTAIINYINVLGLGNSLPYTRLEQIAYDASPGVTNVTGVTLNSATTDIIATNQQVIIPGTVTVT